MLESTRLRQELSATKASAEAASRANKSTSDDLKIAQQSADSYQAAYHREKDERFAAEIREARLKKEVDKGADTIAELRAERIEAEVESMSLGDDNDASPEAESKSDAELDVPLRYHLATAARR